MATWTELKQFLYNSYPIDQDAGDVLRILFNVGGGRSQYVHVHNLDPFVTFSAPFGKVGEIKPEKVLNNAVPFGVAQINDKYTMIHSPWLATLDERDVSASIESLVVRADELEKKLTGKDEF
jgi:hypothetical protein